MSIVHLESGKKPAITVGHPVAIISGGVGGGGGCAIPADMTPVHATISVILAAGMKSIITVGQPGGMITPLGTSWS